MLSVVLQLLFRLQIVYVFGMEIIEKVVVLFGRQPDVALLRATFVRGETASLFSQTCHCLMLLALRRANCFFDSSSPFGYQRLCFGSRPPNAIRLKLVHQSSFVLQYPRRPLCIGLLLATPIDLAPLLRRPPDVPKSWPPDRDTRARGLSLLATVPWRRSRRRAPWPWLQRRSAPRAGR